MTRYKRYRDPASGIEVAASTERGAYQILFEECLQLKLPLPDFKKMEFVRFLDRLEIHYYYHQQQQEKQAAAQLDRARQQLTGFAYARTGADLLELAQSMGMTPEEWEQMKDDTWLDNLNEDEIDRLEDYFDKEY